jgi:glucose/arabinose dehydrogenase
MQTTSSLQYQITKISIWIFILQICFLPKIKAQTGEQLFKTQCSSCHGIADGAFGPKLGGVSATRSKKELIQFIRNPATFLENGDIRTKALFDKYKSEMPPFNHLTDKQLSGLLLYIDKQTTLQKVEPLTLASLLANKPGKRYAPPVKNSNLYIELEDFIKIERTTEHLDDKGVTTIRSNEYGLFVNDQMGQIFRISNRKPELYFDVRKQLPHFIFTPSIGAGLGSFAFHPDFANNGLLYTAHNEVYRGKKAINEGDWPDSLGTEQQYVIDEWKTDTPASFPFSGKKREVLRINTPTFAHSGQDLIFAPNRNKNDPDYGMLYYTFGDGGTANIKRPEISHRIQSVLGSVLRIDPLGNNGVLDSYGIPADNPFASTNDKTIQKEIFAYGFRNPYRICWDENRNNAMYVTDIGEANIEELNVLVKGGDYGWANQEGTYGIDVRKDKTVVFDRTDKGINNTILPAVTYDHNEGNAMSGGFVYEGKIAALKGKYIFGDIVTGRLFYTDPSDFSKGIFDIHILKNNQETTLAALCGKKRTHLRIGYDKLAGDIFTLTKPDNMVRRVAKAYFKPIQQKNK